MTNSSQDIRRLLDLMERSQQPQVLLEGWLDNLKTKRINALGAKQRKQFADRIKKEFYSWLGQTSRQGDLGDMIRFMKKRVGITDTDIEQVLRDAGVHDDQEPEEQSNDAPEPREPENKTPEPEADPEEDGIPLPKDLDSKLSSFGDVGIKVEKNNNHLDAGEILDNPKAYKTPGGDWDQKKISAKLDKMPLGAKLTLGQSTFSRTTKPTTFANDRDTTAESIGEARLDELATTDMLDKDMISDIMDMLAAYINDEYLLNGPKNDHDDAVADLAAQHLRGGGRATGRQDTSATRGSGQYSTQELLDVLRSVNYSKDRLPSLQNKVKRSQSISEMSDQDMDELALIGFAFLRARS